MENILEVKNVNVYYTEKKSLFSGKNVSKHVLKDVSFTMQEGEILGLVGESGCGKTSLAKAILGMQKQYDGEIKLACNNPQMVFQDPYSSLDPRMSIRRILEEPLRIHTHMNAREKMEVILPILKQVGMTEEVLEKYPHEFSGGQRQRIGIARALVTNPQILLCDEPVSALDVSIQAQILNLFRNLQKRNGLTYLFISHDMSVIRHVSDRILVMYLGQTMEIAEKRELFKNPLHPYTKALMRAVPIPNPLKTNQCQVLEGETPSPMKAPAGCPFCTRCAEANARCAEQKPVMSQVNPGHYVACHLYSEEGVQ